MNTELQISSKLHSLLHPSFYQLYIDHSYITHRATYKILDMTRCLKRIENCKNKMDSNFLNFLYIIKLTNKMKIISDTTKYIVTQLLLLF